MRNLIDVKIVQSWETDKIGHLVANRSFTSYDNVYLAGIHMYKSKIFLNKPIYTGVTILKNSKILMYSFYGYLKAKYGPNCKRLFTDTDSFPLNIQAEKVYKDMAKDNGCMTQETTPKNSRSAATQTKRF